MTIILDGTTGITTPSITNTGPISTPSNLNFTGTAQRITGDFSNATLASRVSFQTSTVNGATGIYALPNGIATTASFTAWNNADPTNASNLSLLALSTDVRLQASVTGTGTSLPMTFYTGGAERMRIDTSGNVGIGSSSTVTAHLEVAGLGQAGAPTITGPKGATIYAIAVDNSSNYGGGIEFGGQSNKTFAAWKGGIDNGTTNSIGYLAAYTRNLISDTAMTERLRIDSSGNLLVGTATLSGSAGARMSLAKGGTTWQTGPATANSGNTFYVINSSDVGVSLASGSTAWIANSDERLKTALTPFVNAAEKVSTLRAGTGRYLIDAEGVSRSFLIAQDVQKILPEAVDIQNDEQGTLGLRYTELIPLLTAAIQEQQAMLTQQAAALTALTAQVSSLNERLTTLETK